MIIKITAIEKGKRGNYNGTEVKGFDENGKEHTLFLFDKSPALRSFKEAGLDVGDVADITMEKRGKYWNPSEFTKSNKTISAPANGGSGGGYQRVPMDDHPKKVERINRSVAIKAASEILPFDTSVKMAEYKKALYKLADIILEYLEMADNESPEESGQKDI